VPAAASSSSSMETNNRKCEACGKVDWDIFLVCRDCRHSQLRGERLTVLRQRLEEQQRQTDELAFLVQHDRAELGQRRSANGWIRRVPASITGPHPNCDPNRVSDDEDEPESAGVAAPPLAEPVWLTPRRGIPDQARVKRSRRVTTVTTTVIDMTEECPICMEPPEIFDGPLLPRCKECSCQTCGKCWLTAMATSGTCPFCRCVE
jgi:hypothetical protein